jgi:glycosidase
MHREMRLVQDVVINHIADDHGWDGAWGPAKPERGFALRPERDGTCAPTQPQFDRNDVRKTRDRKAAIYHWNPTIRDHSDRHQQVNWQLADLDDLNTETPPVHDALRESDGYWIREVGVDGFRVDTAFHVTPEFFDDVISALRIVSAAMGTSLRLSALPGLPQKRLRWAHL